MLVRVQGKGEILTDSSYRLNLNIPSLYLDDANYVIALRMFMLIIRTDLLNTFHYPDEQLLSIRTSAVDKSAVNPTQEIASIYTNIGSGYNIIHYEPTLLREYKIQITSLHSADFILTSSAPDAGFDIESVEILFEIKRDARV